MLQDKKLSDRLVFSIAVVIVFHLVVIKMIDFNYEDSIQSNEEQRSFQIQLLNAQVLVPENKPLPEEPLVDIANQETASVELESSNLNSSEFSKVEGFVQDKIIVPVPEMTTIQPVSKNGLGMTAEIVQPSNTVVISQQEVANFARSKAKSMFQDMWEIADSEVNSKNINVKLSDYNKQVDLGSVGNTSETRTVVEGTFYKAEPEVKEDLRQDNRNVSSEISGEVGYESLIVIDQSRPFIEPSDKSQSDSNQKIASSITTVEWESPGEGRKILEQRDPVIPRDIPLQGVTYRVVVLFRLLPTGLLSGFRVIEGSGIAELDAAVVESLRKWRFVASPGAKVVNGKIPFLVKTR